MHSRLFRLMIAIGVEGWWFGKVSWPLRILALGGSVFLMDSGLATDLIGLGVIAAITAFQIFFVRKKQEGAVKQA